MSRKLLGLLGIVMLVATSAHPALANFIAEADITPTCKSYSFFVIAKYLNPATTYSISYEIDLGPAAAGFPITGSIPIPAGTSGTFSTTVTGTFTALNGTFEFTGNVVLNGASPPDNNPVGIFFSPAIESCVPPPPPSCVAQSLDESNFNGTAIGGGDYIWFNANFTASGIPSTGATVTLTNSNISFTAGSTPYNLTVPNATITFSPSASCTSTTFDTATGTWNTTVPVSGDDEIFLTGLAFPVPASGLPGGINPVDWQGTFGTNGTPGISVNWKWSAALYSSFTTDYNALNVKPGHKTACGINNGDHAGTPEGVNNSNQPWKQFVVGGTRGGGGSNWTGSWSGTMNTKPLCQ